MAASSTSPPAGKSPRRGWRYSLRALLIFFTLVCVGVWYWYRVPYREEIVHPRKGQGLFAEGRKIYFAAKEVRHYRRVLRGNPIREGLTEHFDDQGNRIGQENWREGKLHGRFVRWYPSGNLREQGEYRLGAKTGVWELFGTSGELVLRTPYDQNWPHGDAQWFEEGKVTRTVRYDRGEVTQIDGRDVDDPLGRARRERRIDNERIAQMLDKPAQPEFTETPLIEVTHYVSTCYQVNLLLDRRALSEAGLAEDLPINLRDQKRITAQLMLIMVCEPHGLAATYRFGMIWITTKDNAKNWTDRTGVSELLSSPPPGVASDSRESVAAALSRPALFDFLDTPVSEIGRYLSNSYQLPIECDPGLKFEPITSLFSGVNLQNALGALCDQNNLRIRWKDAATLVIEPQDASEPQSRRAGRQ